jgi:hypothetical protein
MSRHRKEIQIVAHILLNLTLGSIYFIYQMRRKTSPFRAERSGALPPGKSFGQRHLFAL